MSALKIARHMPDVLEEHAEEAAILWNIRRDAVHSPDYDLDDLADLDERIEAHLDGLRIAGDAGWQACTQLNPAAPEDFFVLASQALYLKRLADLQTLIDEQADDPEVLDAISGAFAWATPEMLSNIVVTLLNSGSEHQLQVGLNACRAHRVRPGEVLQQALQSEMTGVRDAASQLVGTMALHDQRLTLEQQPHRDNCDANLWKLWSLGLLGDAAAITHLSHQIPALELPENGTAAMQLVARRAATRDLKSLFQQLAELPDRFALALMGAGCHGDPVWLPELFKHLHHDVNGEVARRAILLMTGFNPFQGISLPEADDDFDDDDTDQASDEPAAAVSGEEIEEQVARAVSQWWLTHQQTLQSGIRHISGKPVNEQHLREVLVNGSQLHRRAAALELAIMGHPYVDTEAPGFRQRQQLTGK